MADRAKVESILREMYEARARGDVDALMHHCDEGMHFCISGCSSASPVPLAVEGGSSVREAVTSLVAHFKFSEPDLRALVVEGGKAAAHWRVQVRPATGGDEVETELLDLVEFRGDRIVSYRQFVDTALAGRLLAA